MTDDIEKNESAEGPAAKALPFGDWAEGELIRSLLAEPEETVDLETAKQLMRVEVAKLVLPAIIQYAGVGSPEMAVDSAFAHAELFVARAFAPVSAATEVAPEEGQ